MTLALATRHYCPHRASPGSGWRHDEGNGRAPRRYCSGCGGTLASERGLHGVFAWRGDGRYPAADAYDTFTRPGQAQRCADRLNNQGKPGSIETAGGFVVRWIPETMITGKDH